jgi:hypothetical protein
MQFSNYTEILGPNTFIMFFPALRIGLPMFFNVKHENSWYEYPSAAWNFCYRVKNVNIIFYVYFFIMT